ncbi:MAG: hypothetical protein IPM23_04060 [Candidatus Melainabacteria bacterium]|nr:hypothetical protein [Candidatus Melainabacteria bacterium]
MNNRVNHLEIRMPENSPSRLAIDLPQTFLSPAFDEEFIAVAARCFEQMLRQAASRGESYWRHKTSRLAGLGLTELQIARVRDVGPVEVVTTNGDGSSSSRFVDFGPLNDGYERLIFRLDRGLLDGDAEFRELCGILAYMLCLRIFRDAEEHPSPALNPVLLKLTPEVLGEYVDRHHRGELGADSLSRFIILKALEDEIDALPVWRIFDRAGRGIAGQ